MGGPCDGHGLRAVVLAAHYGRPVLRVTSHLIRQVPRTPFGPLNSALHAASLTPEVLAAIMHGVLVGPVAPTQEERSRIEVPVVDSGPQQ